MDRRCWRHVWMVCVGLGALGLGRCDAAAAVLINEILADPPANLGDANGDGVVSSTQDEFMELVNTGGAPVSLADWRLSDAAQVRHIFGASTSIPAYGFFVVFGGGSPQGFAQAATASSGGLSLNNAGDTVTLRDALLALVDSVAYGTEGGHDASLTRSPDAAGPFVLHTAVDGTAFSPGLTIDGSQLLPHASIAPASGEVPAPPAIPEPASLFLWSMGLAGFPLARRRRSIMSPGDEKTPVDHRHPLPAGGGGPRGLPRYL